MPRHKWAAGRLRLDRPAACAVVFVARNYLIHVSGPEGSFCRRDRLSADFLLGLDVIIPTPSIRITRSLRVSAALSVIGLLLGRYGISGIAVQSCVIYGRLVAFIAYLKP